MKILNLDVYAVYESWRVNIVSFQRVGAYMTFHSMSALRSEEQEQQRREQQRREEQLRVQQFHQQYVHHQRCNDFNAGPQARAQNPEGGFNWPLAILGAVGIALACIFRLR